MRHLMRLFLALALLISPAAGIARAADIRDLLLLKQAGLGDDILIDLIQSDGSVFHLKAADIVEIRNKGLSERVIRAMLATAKPPAPPEQAPAQALGDVPDAPLADRARGDLPASPDQAPPEADQPPVTLEGGWGAAG